MNLEHFQKAYHTDKTEVSSSGFGKSPDSRTSSSNDHHSRLESSKKKGKISKGGTNER